jgi:hypothetical protein
MSMLHFRSMFIPHFLAACLCYIAMLPEKGQPAKGRAENNNQ